MESKLSDILLALLIPFSGYKAYRIYRKIDNLSKAFSKNEFFKFDKENKFSKIFFYFNIRNK